MRILALEPYHGGSHWAFLDGWTARSQYAWTVLTLPPFKWKWRMRHAAHTFAEQARERLSSGDRWDLLWCSDMLNLAEFLGLAAPALRHLPSVVYFHENQLTYPVQFESERDYHFGYTNMTSALAATSAWFNSAYNRDSFLEALPAFLKRMPDFQPFEAAERIRAKSALQPPGIDEFPTRDARPPGPLRILWAARWEHDKNPAAFFAALRRLKRAGVPFRASALGEHFRRTPPIFAQARQEFHDEIDRWGYQPRRADYVQALLDADVFVSTADHEFFGLSAVEAIAAGAYPLLPRRLSYPELLADLEPADAEAFLYDDHAQLSERLRMLADRLSAGAFGAAAAEPARRAVLRFCWSSRAPELDGALERVASAGDA